MYRIVFLILILITSTGCGTANDTSRVKETKQRSGSIKSILTFITSTGCGTANDTSRTKEAKQRTGPIEFAAGSKFELRTSSSTKQIAIYNKGKCIYAWKIEGYAGGLTESDYYRSRLALWNATISTINQEGFKVLMDSKTTLQNDPPFAIFWAKGVDSTTQTLNNPAKAVVVTSGEPAFAHVPRSHIAVLERKKPLRSNKSLPYSLAIKTSKGDFAPIYLISKRSRTKIIKVLNKAQKEKKDIKITTIGGFPKISVGKAN